MKLYKLLFFLNLIFLFTSCNGQKNPKYIGKKFGTFELDKITFTENVDLLFSKVNKSDFVVFADNNSHFDTLQKKQILSDTIEIIYRIKHKKSDGLYSFQKFEIKKEVVSFYIDKQKRFRRVDFGMYLTKNEYKNLLSKSTDYKDITIEQVRKFNNDKYKILQKVEKQKVTTLYCLETMDNLGDYFVRVRINDLKIKNDRFDEKWNSANGY